jgi:sterol desaturase/sphingolipid hydroxylase (fatty acid hydroxylase superfamily)
MTAFEIIELGTLALIPFFLLLDLVFRHRRFETARFWRLRGLLGTVVTLAVTFAVAIAWGELLGDSSLLDGAALGTWWGALVGILLYELVHYGYHRAVHGSDRLWRVLHQMHHSAESLDAFGAYYLHPLDTAMFTTWSSLTFFGVLGLELEAGILANLFLTFNALFQHANIKTPRWLGYVIQRPESHALHHQRGVHRYNYSDLPLWDMLFGTFRNPAQMADEVGFYRGASTRIFDMLIGRDVSEPKAPPRAAETATHPTVYRESRA